MDDPEEICDRYGPIVWRCVYRVLGNEADALDCSQDVLVEMLRSERPCTDIAWLRWLSTRRAIDRLRQRERSSNRIEHDATLTALVAPTPGPPENAAFAELLAALRSALTELSEPQALAFWLRSVEDFSYAEIGERLQIEENAVGVLIHRAKGRLRESMSRFAIRSDKD